MQYELFSVSGDHITTFESTWRFQEGEQIFVHDDNTKRNFIIIRLTHDLFQKIHMLFACIVRKRKFMHKEKPLTV